MTNTTRTAPTRANVWTYDATRQRWALERENAPVSTCHDVARDLIEAGQHDMVLVRAVDAGAPGSMA